MSKTYTLETFELDQDIRLGSSAPEQFPGTSGTDILFGENAADVLRAAEGDDFLLGGAGDDSLNGGDGDDLLISDDNSYFYSGYVSSNFTGDPGGGITSAIADVRDRQFQIDEWYDIFNVFQGGIDPGTETTLDGGASAGSDTLVLDYSAELVSELNFAPGARLPNNATDVLNIDAYWVRGTQVNDIIEGGDQNDRLYGEQGVDVLRGGVGADFVFGGADKDVLRGGDGDDFIVATDFYAEFQRDGFGRATEYLHSLQAIYAQTSIAPEIDTIIDGGDGDGDIAVIDFEGNAAGQAVTFVLNPNATTPLPGIDTQLTNVEGVWVIDSINEDNITGGALDDQFMSFSNGDRDTFDGRGGIDAYVILGASSVDLSGRSVNSGFAANDTLKNIENVIGSFGRDILTGDDRLDRGNKLYGGGDADILNGGEGDDTLVASDASFLNGGDEVNGGDGRDTASYETSVTRVKVDMLTPGLNQGEAQGDIFQEIENLTGTRRGDDLYGDDEPGGNLIDGGLGRDDVLGRGGADTLLASAGDDSLDGGAGVDTLKLSGRFSDYTITQSGATFFIEDERGAGFDGTDRVRGIESFEFLDRTVSDPIGQAPTDIELDNLSIAENSGVGDVVGDLSATDREGDTITFTEVEGSSDLFNVVDGKVVVASGAVLDRESGVTRQTITVRATDKDGSTTAAFDIEITNVDERPTAIALSNATVLEDGARVGDLTVTDPDTPAQDVAYSVRQGGDTFEVVDGELRVRDGVTLDFETDPTIRVTIRATDLAGGFTEEEFVITVRDVPEPIRGDDGPDPLQGTDDDDTMLGEGGADTLFGSLGSDTMDGGAGQDTVRFTAATRFDLGDSDNNSGQAEGDSYTSVERFEFSNRADTAAGGDGDDHFTGNGGNDTLLGLDGADTLSGGAGIDSLSGGDGRDLLDGGDGDDRLNGGLDRDRMIGGDGDDAYKVDNRRDTIVERAGDGDDTVTAFVSFTLGANVEGLVLNGKASIDGKGNELRNEIVGNGAANTLSGLDGADTISGGKGADRIVGGAGSDLMTGNSGDDTFVFAANFGQDRITDFDGGRGATDVILFSKNVFASDDDIFDAMRQVGDDVVIRFSRSNTVTLEDVQRSSLQNDDFGIF